MKYNNVKEIGIGDKVSYNNKVYTVLINYIKDDSDRKGFTPTENWTVLIDDNGDRERVRDQVIEARAVDYNRIQAIFKEHA